MDLTPQTASSLKIIQSYRGAKEAGFRVSGTVFSGPIIVMGDSVSSWNVNAPNNNHFLTEDIRNLSGQIDVLLIGAGPKFSFMTPAQRAAFAGMGFSVDVMDTPAACRTYNVLTMEGRRVAAVLIPCSNEPQK